MQVLQFKTVHLAVIGAIASAFGMAAGHVNAEPLLTYESNKVVDGALSDANVGTQGFLSPNKTAETYTGKNPTADTLSFVNKTTGTNSLVFLKGEGSSLTVSKLSELNFSTEERLYGQAGVDANNVAILVSDKGAFSVTDVQQVNFGTQNKRFQGDQAINSWNSGKLDFSGIKTLAFYTDGGQAINMQSTSSLSIKKVDTLILDNYRSQEGDPERIYSAIQLMVMAGDNNDAPAEQPTIDVDVGNLVIKADSKYTQSAGISVTDRTTDYKGTSSIKGSFAAKNISIDGGTYGIRSNPSVTEKLGSAEKVAGALDSIIGGGAASTLKDNFVGGEASDMTGAWTYDAATGDVSYQGSRLSPTLTAVTHANAANLAQWRYEVNHLSERLGDVRSQNGALGAWARVYGTDAKVSDSVSTKFTNNTIQVGGDAKVGDTWIVGAAFGYTDNSTDFSNGSADSDGYTLSVYGTAVLPTGSYLDLIGRVGRISTDIDVSTVTPFKASYDNTTVGLSAEVGHRFDLSQIFYVTPQAELAYGRVFGDDYSGSNGMKVSQDDFDTLIARIGFQAGANFADNRGSIYLTASVNHDFLGDTEATASKAGAQDQKLKEDLGGTWFSYGIGAQFSTTNNLSFYGSLTRANGSDYQEDYHYSVGARYVF